MLSLGFKPIDWNHKICFRNRPINLWYGRSYKIAQIVIWVLFDFRYIMISVLGYPLYLLMYFRNKEKHVLFNLFVDYKLIFVKGYTFLSWNRKLMLLQLNTFIWVTAVFVSKLFIWGIEIIELLKLRYDYSFWLYSWVGGFINISFWENLFMYLYF